MGFLEVGTPLSWDESRNVIKYIKDHGLLQLLHVWTVNKDRIDNILCWGDEIEYSLVFVDGQRYTSQIFPEASELIGELKVREHIRSKGASAHLSSEWHPEFSNHMIEALPSPPYLLNLHSILVLEPSMRLRRAKIQSVLPDKTFVISLPTFPRFGLKNFAHSYHENPVLGYSEKQYVASQKITNSIFITDNVYNPHPRFPTLVKNVAARRNAKVFIKIPIYKDRLTGLSRSRANSSVERAQYSFYRSSGCVKDASHLDDSIQDAETHSPESDWSLAENVEKLSRFKVQTAAEKTINPVKDHIYMDCLAFGMSMSCVQTTFACQNIKIARYLYDQLVVLSPIFLALSATTPFHRGLLSDYDTRWSALEQSVDCRTEAEETGMFFKDHCTASGPPQYIPKSRYSGVSLYISDDDFMRKHECKLNDTYSPLNQDAYKTLISAGMDHLLAQHYAHLWVRDPIVIFNERIDLDDAKNVDHFENIQSTNWNSVRFKPPPPQFGDTMSPIGWRVEFRSPDVQLTDYENAAGVALVSVIAQAVLACNLSFVIPMSMNDINMKRSWQRDAVTEQKFYFRTNPSLHDISSFDDEIEEMTIYEILAGKPSKNFPGLIPICEEFINHAMKDNLSGEKIMEILGISASTAPTNSSSSAKTNLVPLASPDKTLSGRSESTKNADNLARLSPTNCEESSESLRTDTFQKMTLISHESNVENSDKKGECTVNESGIDQFKRQALLNFQSFEKKETEESTCCANLLGKHVRMCFAHYATLHLNRAAGKLMTGAQFLRKFVLNHPTYRQDSIINPIICYDLTVLSVLLGFGLHTSVDLLGDAAVQQLVLQTPLPAKLCLPELSPEAHKIMHFIRENSLQETLDRNRLSREIDIASKEKRFVCISRTAIELNEIDSIYTMPIGVTARTGHWQKVYQHSDKASSFVANMQPQIQHSCSKCAGYHDLIKLTMEVFEYRSKLSRQQNLDKVASSQSIKLQNVVSNEDFTQAWILKGLDCVGGPTNLESDYGTLLKETRMRGKITAESVSDTLPYTSEISQTMDQVKYRSKMENRSVDHGSTMCTTVCDETTCELLDYEDDWMHEMLRTQHFGFNNEQELEYFQQVCKSSA